MSGTQTSQPDAVGNTMSLPSQKMQVRKVRKRIHKTLTLKYNCSQAPAMMAPTQPQYSHLGTQV